MNASTKSHKLPEITPDRRIRGGSIVKFEGIIGRETERAIHFTFLEGTEDGEGKDNCWFPLSQVISIHRTRSLVNGTNDSIVVSMWIAQQKGLA